jgi:hypothetical protein
LLVTHLLPQLSGSILVIFSLVVLTLPMTIIITKFNYAYEVKKRNFKRSKLSPVSQSDTMDNSDSEGGSSRDGMTLATRLRGRAWHDGISRDTQVKKETWQDKGPRETLMRRETWHDGMTRDARIRSKAWQDIEPHDATSEKTDNTHFVGSDGLPPDLSSLDSVDDVRDSLLCKGRYFYPNAERGVLRDPHL